MATVSASAPRLDPGGAALLAGEYENMLACVRCGACLTSCPTYVLSGHEAEGPRGRIALMRALVDGHADLTPDLVEHEDNCLVCDACTAVCPAGIHMDPMQVALRSAIEPARRRGPRARVVRWLVFRQVFPRMPVFRLVVRLLGLYQRLGVQWLARRLGILRLLRLDRTEAFLPPVAGRFLVPRGQVWPAAAGGTIPERGRAQLFTGCVMSTAFADVDRATARVLARAGYTVEARAGQGCCGALNAHGGDRPMALDLARRTIAAFEGSDGPIVVNAAGCGAWLKDYAHQLREDEAWAERARAFAARVRDASEVLAEAPLPATRPLGARVAYQDACHLLHAQRIGAQPRALLRAAGAEVCEIPEPGLCCGSAGVYNLTNPDESRQLQTRKVDHLAATGAPIVATANPGCLIQLRSGFAERGLPVRVAHLLELLDEATQP